MLKKSIDIMIKLTYFLIVKAVVKGDYSHASYLAEFKSKYSNSHPIFVKLARVSIAHYLHDPL